MDGHEVPYVHVPNRAKVMPYLSMAPSAIERGVYDAQVAIFRNLYRKYYQVNPLPEMLDLESDIDQMKWNRRLRFALITLNPKDGVPNCAFTDFTLSLTSRKWVKSVLCSALEVGTHGRLHSHTVVELRTLYAPSQIVQALYRGRGSRYFERNGIDVKKFPNSDLGHVLAYVKKDENIIYPSTKVQCLTPEVEDSPTDETDVILLDDVLPLEVRSMEPQDDS